MPTKERVISSVRKEIQDEESQTALTWQTEVIEDLKLKLEASVKALPLFAILHLLVEATNNTPPKTESKINAIKQIRLLSNKLFEDAL